MKTLYLMRGLMGSGKSTLSHKIILHNNTTTVRINYDDLQHALYRTYFGSDTKFKFIRKVASFLLEQAAIEGHSIILDNTQLPDKYVTTYTKWCKKNDYRLCIIDLRYVSLEECLKRNSLRDRKVPDKVIKEFYETHIKDKINIQDYNQKHHYICTSCGLVSFSSSAICSCGCKDVIQA